MKAASVKKSSVDPSQVEDAIRAAGINKHNIMRVATSFNKDFKMKTAGKDGVNSLVYLDGPCRVPVTGYFKIWI